LFEFAGELITELPFQSLTLNEMERLHSDAEHLSQLVPELWRTCGRAEAALNVLAGALPNPPVR
jgi:hypothetical protein